MWQKRPDGKRYNWKAAKRYCSNLTLAGNSDWELPSKDVLKDMLDKKHLFDQYKMDGWDSRYWSSTSLVSNTSHAWYVGYGYVDHGSKPNGSYVRCVRGGQ